MADAYTVVAGDTFDRIAAKFGRTRAQLQAANRQVTNIDRINAGQILNIPTASETGNGTTVKMHSVVVNVNGNAVRASSNDIKADRMAAGVYDVTFPENVSQWLWQVSVGSADDSDIAAGRFATTQLGTMGATQVIRVKTFADANTAADQAFHLRVSELR